MSWSCYVPQTSTETLAEDLTAAKPSPPDLNERAAAQFAAAKIAVAALVAANTVAEGPLSVSMSGHGHTPGVDALDMISISVSARIEQPTGTVTQSSG